MFRTFLECMFCQVVNEDELVVDVIEAEDPNRTKLPIDFLPENEDKRNKPNDVSFAWFQYIKNV